MDSFSLFFGQEKADTSEGDAGRLWCGYLPGDCHHSHGDAQNPAAGCRTYWYVDFSSLCPERGKSWTGLSRWSWEDEWRKPFSLPLLSHVRDTTDVAEVSPPLPSLFSPTLCSAGFAEALAVTKGSGVFAQSNRLGKQNSKCCWWMERQERWLGGQLVSDSNMVDPVHPRRD